MESISLGCEATDRRFLGKRSAPVHTSTKMKRMGTDKLMALTARVSTITGMLSCLCWAQKNPIRGIHNNYSNIGQQTERNHDANNAIIGKL